ncbi:Double-stranded RNA-binding domain,Ribonuclease III domain,Ribonuclease III [Cinara cedri]|uniref:Ribonuclease 3 n=1 Tax=Cinara cedri TaxID=506608 RepID=A0A5E4MJ14_9HEMI|nr:Double-stranded RNA-binding domain,Ribonuclease III domain,Ribonuclease III [Cinara cedri]
MQPYDSSQSSINYQQNQPMDPNQGYYNNEHNIMQQVPNNGMNDYYYNTPTTSQFPYNNGSMSTNVPYVSPSTNTLNISDNNHYYIPQNMQLTPQPTLSFSYNNIISPNPNVYFDNASVYQTNVSNLNMHISSNPTSCYQGENFAHNMPLPVNPLNINYGSPVSGSNNQHVPNSRKDDEWFNLTRKFLNNPSKNSTRNISSVSNTHQSDSKQKHFFKNQSINTRNPTAVETKISEKHSIEQIIANEKKKHYHSFKSDLYYRKCKDSNVSIANDITLEVCNEFERVLGKRATDVNALKPVYSKPRKSNVNVVKHKCTRIKDNNGYDSSSSSDEDSDYKIASLKEITKKSAHPDRLHPELWFNELGEMIDGPVCRCNLKAQRSGIRHNIYIGEGPFEPCIPTTNNAEKLYHYRITITPNILELVDLDLHGVGNKDGCPQFHFMPRFVRDLPNNNKELLPMCNVLKYLLNSNKLLFEENSLPVLKRMTTNKWQDIVDEYKGMIITNPGTKPCSIRVDQLDREYTNDSTDKKVKLYPVVVHFGIRPPQLSYIGNPDYQKAWKDYVKCRHLLANMVKPSSEDKQKLRTKERALHEMRSRNDMKRGVTAVFSSKGFYKTGLMCDIVQHAMLLPVLACHFRFHKSLEYLEKSIGYKFKNKYLLQLALTHPSYRENFGTNPDHARNTLTNCGIRQPEYGDRRIHYMNTRKRGINTLINVMSQFGKKSEIESNIMHNERLEFLGDAVVEFVSTIHLFHILPDIEEGGLATFRSAIVQNQHLAMLAKTLKLDDFMLYAHSSDICHNLELKHAMANCFEALMGALFLDGGIEVADRVFGETLFKDSPKYLDIWVNYPKHPLQQQEPKGDRRWIKTSLLLQKLTRFEESIGIKFNHIRLLARAFTDKSVGFTNLTLGSNQRLEFLGDTVHQLITSEYLYKYFPEHHEGHLSLLRSSLVNNRTQSVVSNDLNLINYASYANPKLDLKTKDRADLLEAFLGVLYIDKGLNYCQRFCNVCFFPRLQDFILKQDWNDPKSKLQQCCLTLRSVDGGEPDIPMYKVIESIGPTNSRKYTVAVYFKGVRLSQADGHSIQQAEMNAANSALEVTEDLFPQLDHQKKAISKSLRHQSADDNTHFMDIETVLKSHSSKSDSHLSETEKNKNELHKKLLAVLCSGENYNDEIDELERKNPKKKPNKRKT